MNSIEDAQKRWQNIRAQGRKKGFAALVVIVVILLAIVVGSGTNAGIVVAVVVAAVVVVGALAIALGKKQTGLSITPEWKPKTERAWSDDEDEEDGVGKDSTTAPEPDGASALADDDAEPIRRLDAQILGVDLTKLGQVVDPKLAKSYAMGYLDLAGGTVSWQPSVVTTSKGIDPLESAPAEVASVERTALWGSWALIRVVRTDGTEWCMRVPGSVDLAPAFGDLGLTLQTVGE